MDEEISKEISHAKELEHKSRDNEKQRIDLIRSGFGRLTPAVK
jgi:hypothetical protein